MRAGRVLSVAAVGVALGSPRPASSAGPTPVAEPMKSLEIVYTQATGERTP